jgi:hypothetical protein
MNTHGLTVAGLLTVALLAGACEGLRPIVEAGPAGAVFRNGGLESTERATVEATFNAAKAGLEQLGFRIKRERRDPTEGHLTGVDGEDGGVSIDLHRADETLTRLSIHVKGGDEGRTRRVYEVIRARLE